jgi:pimeloyl-ACP methyl ester carboxylesterase
VSLRQTIVFAHANGFPAGTYRLLFEAWRAAGYTVHAIDKLGHDPAWPVTGNWPHLRTELIDFIEAHAGRPVWLVGHSLGGMLGTLAASKRPDLVAGLVLLDAPVIAGWRAHSLRVAQAAGLYQRLSPGIVSRQRRQEWPNRDAVQTHFATKPAFARWDPRVLADYVDSGFVEHDGRVVLAFDRAIETRIYETIPHHTGRLLRRHPLHCPVAFVAGRESREMRLGGLHASSALAQGRFEWTQGSHLFPMEHPQRTAELVLQLIRSMH